MRKPFPNTDTIIHPRYDASLTYHGYGSAGGNPDKRADKHMWRFRAALPKGWFEPAAPQIDGLVSVYCYYPFDAMQAYEKRHGYLTAGHLSLCDLTALTEERYQTQPQTFSIDNCDDAKQSVDWSALTARQFKLAVKVLTDLVREGQSVRLLADHPTLSASRDKIRVNISRI